MDFHSLAAAHMPTRRRPSTTNARTEARYWCAQARPPRPKLRLLAPIATAAGVILLLIGIAQT